MPRTVGWPAPVAYFLRLEGHIHTAVFLLRHEAAYRPPRAQERERVLALIDHLTAALTDRILDSDRQQVGGRQVGG